MIYLRLKILKGKTLVPKRRDKKDQNQFGEYR